MTAARAIRRTASAVLVPHILGPLVLVPLVLVAVAMSGGRAFGHSPDPVLGSTFWPKDAALTFRWRAGEVPPAAMQTAIKAAAADSNSTRASRAATYTYATSGANPIEYGLDVTCGTNGLACFTRSVPNGFTMGFREHGHRFDWGTLRWCQMLSTPWPSGCYDVENIALDEFGHIEGLAHHVNHADDRDYADAIVQTFARTKPSKGWNAHAYGRCDVATLQLKYDVASAATKISTCLNLATVSTIAASPTSISPGQTVTFTATLKVASGISNGQLSGNSLSGRPVSLQRRPLGASTWTTFATMSAGASAGVYVATTSPVATYEWRASFTAPSTEGLRSSVSASIPVAIGIPCKASAAEVAPAAPCV